MRNYYSALSLETEMRYRYLGDKLTRAELKGATCEAIKINGRCVRGKNSTMLVQFENGLRVTVLARLLRKIFMVQTDDPKPAA